jgi:hypothetical protein
MQTWQSIWAVDFEFTAPEGSLPRPLCVVAHDLAGGRWVRQWLDGESAPACPYGTGPDDLFVSYYASAEIGCHIELGWPIPARILDLCAEFRREVSGVDTPHDHSLIGALLHYGLRGAIGAQEKSGMRDLAMRGGPYTETEKHALLEYCESDVLALARLWPKMAPTLDVPRAVLRGRYMASLAQVERNGVPLDAGSLSALRVAWDTVKPRLIERIDESFGVYEGTTFKLARFESYLVKNKISWPRTATGLPDLSDDVFKEQALLFPALKPLRELRGTIGRMRDIKLSVGPDNRNRTMLSAFGSKTGRNQPSSTRFIFGPAKWARNLIKPPPGTALAYVDWEQQEFGIAAALSGDPAMMEAYVSGDPYLAFARMANAVPANATKDSHPMERERFKVCVLAVQYGQGENALAARLGLDPAYGREMLARHKQTFSTLWEWFDKVQATAADQRRLLSPFGWQLCITPNTKPTTIRNWPCQAAGADMLRLAIIGAVEHGIRVCAPVHDALLIEAPIDQIDTAVETTREQMRKASLAVLHRKLEIRTDFQVVRYPERFRDPRGEEIWNTLCELVPGLPHEVPPTCPIEGHPTH